MSMSIWKQVGKGGPEARAEQAMCLSEDGKSIFVFGGQASRKAFNDLWRFDIQQQTWTRLGESAAGQPASRWGATLTAHAGGLLLFGGEQADMTSYHSLYRFCLSDNTWSVPQQQGAAPLARMMHTADVIDWKEGKGILVFAGKNIYNGEELNDCMVLELDGMEWVNPFAVVHGVSLPDECPPRRKRHSAVLRGRQLLVFAGWQGQSNLSGDYWSDFYTLDLDSWEWRHVQTRGTAPAARGGHVAGLNDDKMFIWGGWGSAREMYNELHYIELDDNTWCSFRRGKVPDERFDCSAVVAGGRMYVFGGRNNKNDFFDELLCCNISSVY